MNRREQFKMDLVEMLSEDEKMSKGLPDEQIYRIDNINVYGGFVAGERSIDHNSLLFQNITWENLLEWGTVIVPENKTYISNTKIPDLDDSGYNPLPLNNNHIVKDIASERTSASNYAKYLENMLSSHNIYIHIDSKENLLRAKERYLDLMTEGFYEGDNFEVFDHYHQEEERIITDYIEDGHNLFLSGSNEVFVGKSAKVPGTLQITFFDENGPISDKNVPDLASLKKYVIENNLIPVRANYLQHLNTPPALSDRKRTAASDMSFEIEVKKTLKGNYIISPEMLNAAQDRINSLEKNEERLIKVIEQLEAELSSMKNNQVLASQTIETSPKTERKKEDSLNERINHMLKNQVEKKADNSLFKTTERAL